MARCHFKTLAQYADVPTYRNTPFSRWYRLAIEAFDRLELSEPSVDTALDAYEMGESPGTFASYVAGM